MTLTIGNWFRIGAKICKKHNSKKGWYFGAELKLGRRMISLSFCSWIKRKGWKIKRDVPWCVHKPTVVFYFWRRFTIMAGRQLKENEGRKIT